MPSVIATDSTRRSSINSNISRATRGSARISPASTFQSRKLFHLFILGWHDADSDLGRLAEVRTIECNRRNRPTPQSLPGFLAQALEESVFDHIASLSEASVHDGAGVALRYSITCSAMASSLVRGRYARRFDDMHRSGGPEIVSPPTSTNSRNS